jgi:hypothetical protein
MLLDASQPLKHLRTNTEPLTYTHLCHVIWRHAQTVTITAESLSAASHGDASGLLASLSVSR